MKHPRELAAVMAASAAAVAVAASPAAAAPPTVIHVNNAAGAAYSGSVRLTLTSPVSVTTSLGTASCNRGNIDGTTTSSGALTVSAYNFYNDPGPACTNSAGGSSTTTPVGLPWTGGDINWTGSAGTLRINNMQVTSTSSTIFGNIVCNYRGSGTGNSITMAVTNSTASTQLKATATNISLTKVSSGSNILCPSTATYSAGFDVNGLASGVYNVKLFLS
ncbi:hypothetical protein [Actinomadura parmotrematis]|uniref:Ig-like domain-containing protein n=1 Tax=Actinomadura parmotrematis TaxID=2864039 RepID=A0ABS7FMS4_9ACTN|nr:hypothetical protein [Actinomadura parmotrematis]MBW8481687.1 hypothetical protein [Actinomadura parmotrematis]